MTHTRWFVVGVAFVVLAEALWLVPQAVRQPVDFDSIWHVFIAGQERWGLLKQEIEANAHPPAFFLALRTCLALLGRTPGAYRTVPVLAALAVTVLMALVVRRVTRSPSLGVAAAAALGWSNALADVALAVRAYTLSLACMLAALWAYSRWLEQHPRRATPAASVLFALASGLSVVTHYAMFLVLAGLMATTVLLPVLHRRWRLRLRAEWRYTRLRGALMFGTPIACAGAAYVVHARHWAGRIGYLPEFMFDAAVESKVAFIQRTTSHLIRSFAVGGVSLRVVLSVAAVAAGLWALARPGVRSRLGSFALLLAPSVVLLNIVVALAKRYPYGGAPRHALFHLPLLLVAVFVALHALSRSRSTVPASVVGLIAIINGVQWRAAYVEPQVLEQHKLDVFRQRMGTRGALIADQYNFILLFLHHDDWVWRLEWQAPENHLAQVWSVSKGSEHFKVCRSWQWLADLRSAGTYADAVECLERSGEAEVTVFRPAQPDVPQVGPLAAQALHFAQQTLEPLGQTVTRSFGEDHDLYVAFSPTGGVDAARRIEVLEASYGLNCTPSAHGNATSALKAACDGRVGCVATADVAMIGDPAVGCQKDLRLTFRCGHDTPRSVELAAEAAGQVTMLSCLP